MTKADCVLLSGATYIEDESGMFGLAVSDIPAKLTKKNEDGSAYIVLLCTDESLSVRVNYDNLRPAIPEVENTLPTDA